MTKHTTDKRTNNYIQSNTQKTEDRATRTPLKIEGELRGFEKCYFKPKY